MLRTADSCHLCACRTLRGSALLGVSGPVVLIAETAHVDFRSGFVLKFDNHIDFAGFGKLILQITDGGVVCVLRAIEAVIALSVSNVVRSTNQVHEQAQGQQKRQYL